MMDRSLKAVLAASHVIALLHSSTWAADSSAASTDAPSSPFLSAQAAFQRPMAAGQIQTVRSAGRAVLISQKRIAADPEILALKKEIEALGQELEQARAQRLTTPPVLNLKESTNRSRLRVIGQTMKVTPITYRADLGDDGKFMISEVAASESDRDVSSVVPQTAAGSKTVPVDADLYAPTKARLARIEARVQQHIATAQQSGDESRLIVAQSVAGKITQLHDELQAVLSGEMPDGGERFAALLERLRMNGVAAEIAKRQVGQPDIVPETPTPTLTTRFQPR